MKLEKGQEAKNLRKKIEKWIPGVDQRNKELTISQVLATSDHTLYLAYCKHSLLRN